MAKRKLTKFYVDDHGCFICTSRATTKLGYYHYTIGKKKYLLHRIIYTELFGPIAPGNVVRHSCDNPGCINPEHLLQGTQGDNIKDRVDRKRGAFGEKVTISVLKESEVLDIMKRLETETNRSLAKEYGVNDNTIRDIRIGKTWKHLNDGKIFTK